MVGTLSYVLAAVFLYAAAVQYNDPDPVRWTAFYGVAALVSLFSGFRPLPPIIPLVLAVAAGIGAAVVAPTVWADLKMTGTEEERELAGLLLVGAWMLVLAHHHQDLKRRLNG